MRSDLPTGTLTFLVTDVEGSTRILRELGAAAYADVLAEHRRLIRQACAAHDGIEVDTQGDAFFFAFPTAPGALAAAEEMTEALASGLVYVRIGLHTGTPLLTEEGYVGGDVHRVARIAAAGHGGQVLVSSSTAQLIELELTDLGEHRLKDLSAPERIYQLGERAFPALKSLYRTNLPVPATPFVGREQELAEVLALLSSEDTRLLTLTGPGGTGKTRLALQTVAEASDHYPDGVWWIPLAHLREPELVLETAAQVVGSKDGLAEHISDKSMLYLFDNFEQVVEAGAELASLLASCPNLDFVITSRERLRVSGEQTYPVPPLAEEDGEALFSARARAVDPSFASSDAVGRLCLRLDELPLALELAAARTALFSPEQLLERLSERLDLLRGGRDADPRQQTLRATIEWSYELMNEREQGLFARLSVFAGGCSYEAAEHVADADPDTLQSLLDKSLLRKRESDFGPRYWMLETIRQYAAERLEGSGEIDDLHRRHAEYLVAFAEAMEPELIGPDPARALDRVDADIDNIRAAFGWARDTAQSALELRLAYGSRHYWTDRGLLREGRDWLEGAAVRGPVDMAWQRAMVLGSASVYAMRQGDLAEAQRLAEEQVEIARPVGGATLAAGLWSVAAVLTEGGEIERGRALYEEAVAVTRETGPPRALAISLLNLAGLEAAAGDFPRALEGCREALVTFASAEYAQGEAYAMITLGSYLIELSCMDEGLAYARDGLLRSYELGNPNSVAAALLSLADAARLETDHARGARLLGAALSLLEETGEIFGRNELDVHRRVEADARQTLGDGPFETAWAEGRAMSTDEAVAYALRP